MCGKGRTHVTKTDYHLRDENGAEFVVPDLEVEECDHCGQRIFNMQAVRKARQTLGANPKLLIHLKPDLHKTLVNRAQKSNRSLDEEVQRLIEESLRDEPMNK